jgi:hypothetical protein
MSGPFEHEQTEAGGESRETPLDTSDIFDARRVAARQQAEQCRVRVAQ